MESMRFSERPRVVTHKRGKTSEDGLRGGLPIHIKPLEDRPRYSLASATIMLCTGLLGLFVLLRLSGFRIYTAGWPLEPVKMSVNDVSVPTASNFMLADISHDPPQTREYTFVIQELLGTPDGVQRPMFVVNGTYPGPTIHANQYDRVVVNVINELPDVTAMHYHGLFMNSTPFYDGAQGISQCGIQPGKSMIYNFTFAGYSGTTMWHAHYDMQYSDGVVGPLIVNPTTYPPSSPPWDQDVVILIQDWYHETSADLLPVYLSSEGIGGAAGNEPVPDSATINGMGQWGGGGQVYQFNLEPKKTYRLRLINTGTFANIHFSVDDHPLTVVAADGIEVLPFEVSGLEFSIGQRYDVLLYTNQTSGGAFWVRVTMLKDLFTYKQPAQNCDQRAVLRYGVSKATMPSTGSTSPTPSPVIRGLPDLNISMLIPADFPEAPNPTKQYSITFDMANNAQGINLAYINNVTWIPLNSTSTLAWMHSSPSTFTDGLDVLQSDQVVLSHNEYQVVDIILNNGDNGAHPWHMHGHQPWLVASGPGVYDGGSTATFPTKDLMPRDTHLVDASSWVILRYVVNNPGVWAFHCHIAWHMAAGLMMQIADLPSSVSDLTFPPMYSYLCQS